MTDGHEGKRFYSRDDLGYEHNRLSGQSCLQTRIAELIERYQIQNQPPGRSTSGSLMSGFIRHIWPNIRDDYRQMTHSLEEDLKKILKERHIDAEVSSRVKEDASITKTLKRRQEGLLAHGGSGFNSYQDIFYEMHDLSGLRIVLMDREDRDTALKLIEELFKHHKSPAHFHPSREIGQFWRRPWFGAYETHNHRLQLANDNEAALGDNHQYSGVMFEIQITTFSDNLYNKLAHDLLYKADPGLVTGQEEMVIDVSHGLARCFELCMRILRPKLHRDTNNRTSSTPQDLRGNTAQEVKLAQSAVKDFERDLHNRSESDHTAQLLRKLLSKKEDAEDQACLKDLLASDPRHDKTRIEETKGGLLPRSYNWILEDHDFQGWRENGQNKPFWITGAPGKGKTMMLCGIVDELRQESETNVSYFFCQGTDKRINTGTAVLRGLLFLLCKQQDSLISHIRDKYDDAGEKLFEDTNAWVALSEIFKNILGDPGLRKTYLIVDALDECLEESRQRVVKFLLQMSNDHPTVKWIVSSRELAEFKTHLRKALHLSLESKLREESVSAAVGAYINFKVDMLGDQNFSHSAVEEIKLELTRKSEGTFLWVAIVCKELELAHEHNVRGILQRLPRGLSRLYGKLVDDINALGLANPHDPDYCKSVLRAVSVAFRPLTLKELQELADLPQDVPADTVAKMCRSLLTVRDDTVFFVHQSAMDYLSNEWDTVFRCSMRHEHKSIFSKSLKAMEQVLKQDIYKLGHPGISIDDIQLPSPDPLGPIRYSCVYWITHFRETEPPFPQNQVEDFLKLHFLHWFEALSLIRSASACVYALRDLISLGNEGFRSENLLHLARDMYRFAQSYAVIIGKAPLQAYYSALIFSPACSLTRKLFMSKEPDWIVQMPRVEQNWSSCLATLMGHVDEVWAVAFSPDGRHIVSGSSDRTIKIWDAEAGSEILTVHGHTTRISSVAFDKEGRFITSKFMTESDHRIVKTWDSETGNCISISTREEPEVSIYEPTFSSDKRRSASWSARGIIVHNKDESGDTENLLLSDHSSLVYSFVFSPNGSLIASGSDDQTVKIWDAVTGDELSTLRGHTGAVYSVCFSPDGHRIASGSFDNTIKIWDVKVSTETSTLQGPSEDVHGVLSVALTLDGRRIASLSEDNTVTIWDTENGDEIQIIEYDLDGTFWSVTFSPDGRRIAAVAPQDAVVISDTESGATISTCRGPCDVPVALSLDSRYIAAWWDTNTIMIKDAEIDKDVVALSGHSGIVTSVAFSPKHCHIVASASHDKTIKIWNVITRAEISTVSVGTEPNLLKFDPTGAFLYASLGGASLFPSQHSTWTHPTLSQTEVVLPQLRKYTYSVDDKCSWITRQGLRVLWLPPEHRATFDYEGMPSDVLPHMVSIGCCSGRVWWLTFSSNNPPPTRFYKNSGVSE